MPNWCSNTLTVEGDQKDLMKFVEQAKGLDQKYELEESKDGDDETQESVLSFHQIVPIPASVLRKPYDPFGWHAENILWGTQWGADGAEITDEWDGGAVYKFSTAWAPDTFLIRASGVFPTLEFHLRYEGPNNDLFGHFSIHQGKVVRWADEQEFPIKDEEGSQVITKWRLREPLLLVHCNTKKFGGQKEAEQFIKSLDPSLTLAV